MRKLSRYILSMILLLAKIAYAQPLSLIADSALGAPDPAKDWYTLETPHFNIHHEQHQTVFAQRLAGIAERVHATLTPRAGYAPPDKTEIVINDSVDLSNGAATVLPYRQFFIYMAPPNKGELLDEADWVEMVFTHEYMHVLHMDQARGLPAGVRNVFGRWFFAFPQIFNPSWVTEGYAVWAETKFEQGVGRGQSALYDAMMRAEVMNGLRDLTGLSYHGYTGTDWPYGQSYLYGLYFFQFVETTWGKEKIDAFIADWNGNLLPFQMNSRTQHVFGMQAEALHERFVAYLRQRFQPDIDAWNARNASPATPLLAGNGLREQVLFDGSGGVFYHENSGRKASALMHRQANGDVAVVAETKGLLQFDVHPIQGVIMSGLRVCNNIEAHADLFKFKDGHWEAMTDCRRYVSGYWSPRGNQIAAVALVDGRQRLDLLDSEGGFIETLYDAPLGETLGALAWHPQSAEWAVARKPQGERWGLYRFVLATRQWKPVATGGRLLHSPRYDAKGEAIYFIDDTADRLNVRRVDLISGKTQTLTDSLTAITDFDVQHQQLATLEYSPTGIALQVAAFPAGLSEPVVAPERYTAPPFVPLPDGDKVWNLPPAPYNPLETMAPTAWLALLGADGGDNGWIQLLTSGGDVLGFHSWQVAPRLYYDQENWGGDIAYVFHRRLALLASRTLETSFEPDGDVPSIIDIEDRTQLVWTQPVNDINVSWQLNVGVAKEDIRREQQQQFIGESYEANLAGVSLLMDSSDYYRYSISPENGRHIKLSAEKYAALGAGDFRGESFAADWNEYLSTWNNQVLALRWVEARADEEARVLDLGGAHDSFETLASQIGFGKTTYALRGYDTGLDALTGHRLRLQTLEYRMPVANVFDGFLLPPLGLGKLSATVFYDRGAAWEPHRSKTSYAGTGAELNADILLGYNLLPLDVTMGVAQGLDDELGTQEVYVRLGAAF